MALLPKGQREQGLVFVGFLAVVAIGAFWYFVYSPRSDRLDEMQAHSDQLVQLNQKAKSEVAKGTADELRKQLVVYQQNLALIRTLVPTGNEVPSLLEQVSTAARRVGLDLAAVDPQPVNEGDDYDTYRYTISVIGGYHQLGQFLANVGSLARIVLPVNMTLQAPAPTSAIKSRQAPATAQIEARFQLQTYVARRALQEDGQPMPPKKAGVKS
jgi:type IV pilus assembly protein PilO